jgi:3-hydroxyisobutyrate dehydrogenase/2-hydroxy-3-oxopropionate reductase
MGPVGAGQATKLANQLIVSANLAAIAEAIALAERLGVDAKRLPEALQGGFADSRPLQLFGARMAAAVDPGPRGGALNTMFKDITAVRRAAASAELATPMIDRVEEIYRELMDQGLGGEDVPALIRRYRSAAPE